MSAVFFACAVGGRGGLVTLWTNKGNASNSSFGAEVAFDSPSPDMALDWTKKDPNWDSLYNFALPVSIAK